MKLKAAMSWMLVSVMVRYTIKLLGNLTLARLLTPEDFGLTAIVLAVVSGLEAITDVGTKPALIRTHRDDDEWIHTAWTLGVVRGICIGLAVVLAAYPLALFFNDLRLFPMIAATGTMSVLLGLTSITAVTAVRDLRLKEYAIVEIVAAIGGYVVMLGWAWLAPSAWALLSGAIVSTGLFTVASYFAFGSRKIGLCWNRAVLRELTGFGKWVFLSSLIGFAIFQGDKFGVAKLVSVPAAGLYAIASTWALSLQMVFGIFLSQLYLPVSAKLWRKLGPGNSEFLSLRRSVLWMMAIPYALAAGCSDPIVAYLYPHSYFGAGPIMAILVIGGWFSTLEFLYNDQLMVSGEPRWRFLAQVISCVGIGMALVVMQGHFSAESFALIFSGGAFIRALVLIYACDRNDLKQMLPDLAITTIFVALALAIKGIAFEMLPHLSPFAILAIGFMVATPPAILVAWWGMKRIFTLTEDSSIMQAEGQVLLEGMG